uniref:Uncharacterized protein n=1 Tax=Arundo donax TaxID=35708 RepID=A0A0A9F9V5_ARUDO
MISKSFEDRSLNFLVRHSRTNDFSLTHRVQEEFAYRKFLKLETCKQEMNNDILYNIYYVMITLLKKLRPAGAKASPRAFR